MEKITKYVDCEEMKALHRMLERLQADVALRHWIWNGEEKEALVVVMDAVKGSVMDAVKGSQ